MFSNIAPLTKWTSGIGTSSPSALPAGWFRSPSKTRPPWGHIFHRVRMVIIIPSDLMTWSFFIVFFCPFSVTPPKKNTSFVDFVTWPFPCGQGHRLDRRGDGHCESHHGLLGGVFGDAEVLHRATGRGHPPLGFFLQWLTVGSKGEMNCCYCWLVKPIIAPQIDNYITYITKIYYRSYNGCLYFISKVQTMVIHIVPSCGSWGA